MYVNAIGRTTHSKLAFNVILLWTSSQYVIFEIKIAERYYPDKRKAKGW